ncbi:ExbD/TolR family protein [Puniceibacterium sediminis]|uniref:Biopolymer transport protein ExbD n=1 Tax=Puniceibacterium sediminis TaxID=1608407 RepID=A0A238YSH0_9RHOB|nr:biopolymer transporter ExbD [Puniceibacterium sediminis]SNR73543.1 biopolymer transport protein ExbD [Puniceibacterium sediminis]
MSIHRKPRTAREPTIALINVVFLMLVFFMVAGTLAPPMESDLSLVRTADLDGRAPPEVLVIHADGRLSHRGMPLPDVVTYLTTAQDSDVVRLMPDRDLPAETLLRIADEAQAAGPKSVLIITEKALR